MEETIKALKEFICSNILDKSIDLTEDTILKEIGVDSFSIIEIVLFIERKFGKLIPDHLLVPETFSTLRSLATVIEKIEK